MKKKNFDFVKNYDQNLPLKGLSALDGEKRLFLWIFLEVYIIDIDMKIMKSFIYFRHFL